MSKIIPISILGHEYKSINDASQILNISVSKLRTRLDSDSQEWKDWKYLCDPAVGKVSIKDGRDLIPVTYFIVHKPTGSFYVGSTENIINRKSGHLSLLRRGIHYNKKLQDLWTSSNDESLWEWTAVIFNTRQEAYDEEQKNLDKYRDSPLLLNIAKDSQSPVSSILEREELLRRSREGRIKAFDNLSEEEKKEYLSKLRQGALNRWENAESREAWRGAGNPFSKKICVNGVVYGSMKEASAALGICDKTLRHLAKDPRYPNYSFVDDGKKKDDRWEAPGRRERISGANNGSSKKVSIDGVVYDTIKLAAEAIGVDTGTVRRRALNPMYPNVTFITP